MGAMQGFTSDQKGINAFASFLEAVPDAVIAVDGSGAIVAVNDTDVRWLFRRQQRIERDMEQQHD